MPIKVGDFVRNIIHYSNDVWPVNYEFTVTGLRSGYVDGIAKNGKPGAIPESAVIFVSSGSSNSVSPASKFNVGDEVKIMTLGYLGYGSTGTVAKVYPATSLLKHRYEIQFKNGQSPVYGYKDIDLELVPNIQITSSSTSGSTYTSGYSGNWLTINPYYGMVLPTRVIVDNSQCSHLWKFYMGLNERYEYCDKPGCKAKRDTDRRS